jgi:dipeptidyl aminopeptidase/acylaminoacyl peptidase
LYNPSCLLLISPIKSVRDVARSKYGRIVDLLIEERFDNFETVRTVSCPSAIFHGNKDKMVPFQHSLDLLVNAFTNCKAHMFLRNDMQHNKFDYNLDIIRPFAFFLEYHGL